MGLLGVARAKTAVGVCPETFLLLQLLARQEKPLKLTQTLLKKVYT
jgi:hypothetical protein